MKIRLDYVTNSSASSFLVAKKEGSHLSQESREKLAELFMKKFLNGLTMIEGLTVENARTHENMMFKKDETIEKVINALHDGYQIEECMVEWDSVGDKVIRTLLEALDILIREEGYRLLYDDMRD